MKLFDRCNSDTHHESKDILNSQRMSFCAPGEAAAANAKVLASSAVELLEAIEQSAEDNRDKVEAKKADMKAIEVCHPRTFPVE